MSFSGAYFGVKKNQPEDANGSQTPLSRVDPNVNLFSAQKKSESLSICLIIRSWPKFQVMYHGLSNFQMTYTDKEILFHLATPVLKNGYFVTRSVVIQDDLSWSFRIGNVQLSMLHLMKILNFILSYHIWIK